MKDEIKETINWLNQIIKENKESDVSLNSCVIPFETLYILQDYITNLQEELEEQKRIEQASLDTINNLQEENEKLKQEVKNLKFILSGHWEEYERGNK